MLPAHSPELAAIANQLADELDAYADGLNGLLERRWDPDLYRKLSEQFDRMQLFAQALPRLATSWSELVITRVELTHALFSLRSPNSINHRVASLHAQHAEVIREVRGKCKRYFADEAGGAPVAGASPKSSGASSMATPWGVRSAARSQASR